MSNDITDQMRHWCNEVRRNPSPLADAIPMVQRASDEITRVRAERDKLREQLGELRSRVNDALDYLDAEKGMARLREFVRPQSV